MREKSPVKKPKVLGEEKVLQGVRTKAKAKAAAISKKLLTQTESKDTELKSPDRALSGKNQKRKIGSDTNKQELEGEGSL